MCECVCARAEAEVQAFVCGEDAGSTSAQVAQRIATEAANSIAVIASPCYECVPPAPALFGVLPLSLLGSSLIKCSLPPPCALQDHEAQISSTQRLDAIRELEPLLSARLCDGL